MRPFLRYISIPFLAIGLLAAGAIGDAAPPGGNHLVITPLSTGADRVSGGDVLVRIDVPGSAGLADVQVTLNGNDVTGTFVPDPTSHALVGLVTGLVNGDN